MANQNVCKYNKFGYCRYRETCRNLHIDEICEYKTYDITTCRQRHPRECRYFREYSKCKFDPCKFKHILHISQNADIEKIVKDIQKCNEQLEVFEMQIKKMEEVINEKEN